MKIARQLVLYFVFGCTQFAVDTLLLVLLTRADVAIAVANPVSRACASVLGLVLNFTITFRRGGVRGIGIDTVFRYAMLWLSLTVASTALIALLLELRPDTITHIQWVAATKIAVEMFLFLVSFFLSRQWVYRTPPKQ